MCFVNYREVFVCLCHMYVNRKKWDICFETFQKRFSPILKTECSKPLQWNDLRSSTNIEYSRIVSFYLIILKWILEVIVWAGLQQGVKMFFFVVNAVLIFGNYFRVQGIFVVLFNSFWLGSCKISVQDSNHVGSIVKCLLVLFSAGKFWTMPSRRRNSSPLTVYDRIDSAADRASFNNP